MITIPEIDKYNGSYYDAYKAIYSLVAHEVTVLRTLFPEGAVDSIDGYKVGVLTKLMHAACSFMVVIEQTHDYASAATILRSIADNLASYILIYHDPNNDEVYLRHNLFLYDGFRTRLNAILSIKPTDNKSISELEKKQVQQDVELAVKNTNNAIKYSLSEIRGCVLYGLHKTEIEYLIKLNHDNWKYESLLKYKHILKWKDMYPIINGKESSSFFLSYLSQYVHGLSSSNLSINNTNPDTFAPMIGIGITFLGKINEFVQKDFGVELTTLMHGFLDSEYGIEHFSYINPIYLEEILKKTGLKPQPKH